MISIEFWQGIAKKWRIPESESTSFHIKQRTEEIFSKIVEERTESPYSLNPLADMNLWEDDDDID